MVWVGLGVFYASWAFGGGGRRIELGADLLGTARRTAPASRHQSLLQRKSKSHEASHPTSSPEMLKPMAGAHSRNRVRCQLGRVGHQSLICRMFREHCFAAPFIYYIKVGMVMPKVPAFPQPITALDTDIY